MINLIPVLTARVDHDLKAVHWEPAIIKADDTLHELYRLIGCDLVQFVRLQLGEDVFDVWCDEEFAIKGEKMVPTLGIDTGGSEPVILCNNLVITRTDEDGNTTGLKQTDFHKLINYAFVDSQKILLRFMEELEGLQRA